MGISGNYTLFKTSGAGSTAGISPGDGTSLSALKIGSLDGVLGSNGASSGLIGNIGITGPLFFTNFVLAYSAPVISFVGITGSATPAQTSPAALDLGASNGVDWNAGNCFYKTLSGATTFFGFTNNASGRTIVLSISNPNASYIIGFSVVTGNVLHWSGVTISPTITSGASGTVTDVFTFIQMGSTNIFGNAVQNFL